MAGGIFFVSRQFLTALSFNGRPVLSVNSFANFAGAPIGAMRLRRSVFVMPAILSHISA